MPIIELNGCTPEPLMNYLKALGVLRIIVGQGLDPIARGFWKNNVFCLHTELTEDQIVEFFATRYQPSPILSPWNGAGGFEKARGADVAAIALLRSSNDPRLSDFQKAIRQVDDMKRASPDMEKDVLLLAARNRMPDGFLQWFDSCAVYMSSKFSYSPYLGCLFLSGTSNKKMDSTGNSKAVFPFTTNPSAVGNSMLQDSQTEKGKGELWLPLWDRASSLGEIQLLFGEGRAELRGKQAQTGVDFSRAIAGLGVDRGIKSFVRFSFDEHIRAGVMATPLGQFEVAAKNDASLLREIDNWLSAFRRACGDKAPARFQAVLREIERGIFDYCQYGDTGNDKARFQRILVALGNAEHLVASAPKFRADAKGLRPLAALSSAWVAATDDHSPEFGIALALASISNKEFGSIRLNLEDVEAKGRQYGWSENSHSAVWSGADLATNLSAVLYRRVMDADKTGDPASALTSSHRATLADLGEFLAGNLDDVRIVELLWGLSLCETWKYRRAPSSSANHPQGNAMILPVAYCLLKLLFHTPLVQQADEGDSLRPNLGILGLLRADRVTDACQRAVRLLRGQSLMPKPFPMHGFPSRDDEWLECVCSTVASRTLAAALLIPISDVGLASLKKQVLREKKAQDS
ncbi:MAG: type I-U CRISPR-associated protein Csx17 [Verrucomicrobia bacterium]|nr:type I-U CRISPR-associated protein Csx17 [Verrucomicrobiota bacterium]